MPSEIEFESYYDVDGDLGVDIHLPHGIITICVTAEHEVYCAALINGKGTHVALKPPGASEGANEQA